MESEVVPKVLAVIEEKRLSGPRLSPVDIISKMGVPDAREKPFEYAWLASGDSVVVALWGEHVSVGANGRWFCLESLNAQMRAGGDERSAGQVQRAEYRLSLLKRTFDAGQSFRVVLQTNRMPVAEVERNRNAKISTRVRDDEEWHVASWLPDTQVAVLVRGARGWEPSADELRAARRSQPLPAAGGSAGQAAGKGGAARRSQPLPAAGGSAGQAAGNGGAPGAGTGDEDIDAAAKAYVLRHFSSYGYQAADVSSQDLGYDVEVNDKKGAALLRVCVRGASVGAPSRALTPAESASSKREKLWRLIVVADPLSGAAQHKIYKPGELPQDVAGA